MKKTALLVVDLQRDFLEPDGRMPIAASQVTPLIAVSNRLIDMASEAGLHVVYVLNAFERSQWFLNLFRRNAALEGTRGAELDPRVRQVPDAARITKRQADAFSNPELAELLGAAGARRILIVGVFAQACVRATARGGLRAGYQVTVVSDGVGAESDRTRARALEKVKSYGATVEPSASLASSLLVPRDDHD